MILAAAALRQRYAAGTLRRGVMAGLAWGTVMGLGLPALTFLNCGTICLSDVAITSAMSITVGIAIMAPLAAFGSTHRSN